MSFYYESYFVIVMGDIINFNHNNKLLNNCKS